MPDLAAVVATSHGPLVLGLAIASAAAVVIATALAIATSRRGWRLVAVALAVSATVAALSADRALGDQGLTSSVALGAGILALVAMAFHVVLGELVAFDPPPPPSVLDSGNIVLSVDLSDREER